MALAPLFLIGTALLLSPQASRAGDPEMGKSLVDTHCYHCHKTEVYTRPDRRVNNFDQLLAQVRRCELSLGLKWFDEEIENASIYLNQEYYHFTE